MADIDDADIGVNQDDDFYDHEYFDENRMYSRRKRKPGDEATVETGGIRVKQPVRENAQLKKEHVTVENHAANNSVKDDNFAPFRESTIELTEHAEVPVVTKEARVVEEVSVYKNVEFHDETVHDTVRGGRRVE